MVSLRNGLLFRGVGFASKFVLMMWGSSAIAQTPLLEQKRKEVAGIKSVEEQASAYHELVARVCVEDLEAALNDAEAGLQAARRSKSPEAIAVAHDDIGFVQYLLGDNASALSSYREALSIAVRKSLPDIEVLTRVRLANFYRAQGQMDSARHYLAMSQESLSPVVQSQVEQSIGWLNYQTGKYHAAIASAMANVRQGYNDRDAYSLLALAYLKLGLLDSAHYFLSHNFDGQIGRVVEIDRLETFDLTTAGDIAFASGDHVLALSYFTAAYEAAYHRGYQRLLARVSYRLGHVYEIFGNFPEAIQYYYEGKANYTAFDAKQELARINARLGWAYVYTSNHSFGLTFAKESLAEMKLVGDSIGIAFAWNLLGYIEYELKNHRRAQAYYDSAMAIRKEQENLTEYYNTLANQADLYAEKGLLERALDTHLAIEQNELERGVTSNNRLFTVIRVAELYRQMNNYRQAEVYYKKAIDESKREKLPRHLRNAQRGLILLYSAMQNETAAVKIFHDYIVLDDSLNQMANQEQLMRLSAMQEYKMREREMLDLKNKTELAELNNRLNNRRLFYISFIAGLLLLIVLVLAYFFITRHKQATRLNDMYALLQEKSLEIQAQAQALQEANQRLAEMNEALELKVHSRTQALTEANQELETYFYRASHDFRGPVSTLLGLVDIASSTSGDKDSQHLVFRLVKDVALKQKHLIDKLQQLHAVLSADEHVERVDLRELVNQIISNLKERHDTDYSGITVDIPDMSVMGSTTLLTAILDNIIENAFIFTEQDAPRVRIVASVHNSRVDVFVEDDGEGMDKAIQASVFNMFFRGSERSRGNGLGLYIAHKAADRLAAEVTFTTRLHQGTRFRVRLKVTNAS